MKMNKRIYHLLIRLLAFAATLAGAITMVTSHESVNVFNLTLKAKYSNTPQFKYFVIVESISSVYSFITLFVPSKSLVWRSLIFLDLVIAVLLSSSISAALAIAQVGKKGNIEAGWLPICEQVAKFCRHVTGALISGLIAAILYFLLLLYSVHSVITHLSTVKL